MNTRFHFFGGKGGVGKTTCSAATAIRTAEHEAARVLLVSTDPAHSLGDALRMKLGARPKRVAVRRGRLEALELDAAGALESWLRPRRGTLATIAERGTYLDREDVARFLDLSFPGVDELIALLELFRLAQDGEYDEVVVDTAPTGHTLRLLEMPQTLEQIASVLDAMQGKHRMLAEALGGRRRRDVADALIEDLQQQAGALSELLREPEQSELTWVTLPEPMAVAETGDALRGLGEDGLRADAVWINRLTPTPASRCGHCERKRTAEAEAVAELQRINDLPPVRCLLAQPKEPVGVAALRRFHPDDAIRLPRARRTSSSSSAAAAKNRERKPGAVQLDWDVPDSVRLLLFGGKGGVGKSTSSSSAALTLAERWPDRRVLLLSTDPAHSLGDALGCALGDEEARVPGAPANLTVRELDAGAAFAARREEFERAVDELFDALRGNSRFDASVDRAIVHHLLELAPPGLDEVFAVMSVMDALLAKPGDPHRRDVVVVDTAPTGHALRLLEMPSLAGGWVKSVLQILLKYRELTGLGRLAQELVDLSKSLRELRALLTDPAATRFVIVTRPAELPTKESVRLASSLKKLGLARGGVLLNHLTPVGERGAACARCKAAAKRERTEASALVRGLRGQAGPVMLAPAMSPPPRGPRALRAWCGQWTSFR